MADGWVVLTPQSKNSDGWTTLGPNSAPQEQEAPSYVGVVGNAGWKGIASVPDMLLNTPNNIANLAISGVGSALNAVGHPELAPEVIPQPNYARRALTAVGLINPDIVPQGFAQKATDALVQGATGGALTGGSSLPQVAANASLGALSSGAGAGVEAVTGNRNAAILASMAAPAAASRIAAGRTLSPDVETLNKAGVKMTPGQIMGGAVQRIEDALTSVPLLGDAIKAAQRRGFESYGNSAMNMALKPIGAKLPDGIKGNDAVAYTQDKLGAAYDSLRSRMRGSLDGPTQAPGVTALPSPNPSPTLRNELAALKAQGQNLPSDQSRQLNNIIDNEIIKRFPSGQGSVASGDTIKDIESKLGTIAKPMGRSDNYDIRNLGDAVLEAQAALRRMVERENPQHAAELAKINEGYSVFKRVQHAASSVAAKDGVFTPAQLHAAVKAGDISKDKSKFARGDALMQDFSQAGKNVLSQTVPDSGTATRALVEAGLVGAGSGYGYMANHPVASTLIAGGALTGTLPYTPLGQTLLQQALTGKNPSFSSANSDLASLLYAAQNR